MITGIDDVLQAEESLANAIADSIMPAMMPDIEIVTFETRELLVIKVAHWSGPFYLKTEGPEEGVYVRLGPTNRKAGHEILAELHRTKRRVSFDQEPCTELSEDDLDMAKRPNLSSIQLTAALINISLNLWAWLFLMPGGKQYQTGA